MEKRRNKVRNRTFKPGPALPGLKRKRGRSVRRGITEVKRKGGEMVDGRRMGRTRTGKGKKKFPGKKSTSGQPKQRLEGR